MGSITYSLDKTRTAIAEKVRDEKYPGLNVDDAVKQFINDRIDKYETEKKNYV